MAYCADAVEAAMYGQAYGCLLRRSAAAPDLLGKEYSEDIVLKPYAGATPGVA